MSKSYGNTILLSDPESEIRAKLKTMVTDPARIRRTDAGNPDICPVFDLHKVALRRKADPEGPARAAPIRGWQKERDGWPMQS